MKLSENEEIALELLKAAGGCILSSKVPDKNEPGVFGEITPGLGVYKKLEKKGLIFFTEEEPLVLEDGTCIDLTPLICLKDYDE